MSLTQQTKSRRRRTATVAFRLEPDRKHLIRAAAVRYDMLPSDWLRSIAEQALEREFGRPAGDGLSGDRLQRR